MYQPWDDTKPVLILNQKRIFGARLFIACVSVVLVSLAIGFLIGNLTKPLPVSSQGAYYSSLIRDERENPTARARLFRDIDPANIKTHHKYFTSLAHRAGTPGGKAVSDYIRDVWILQGLEEVQQIPYDVLLDVPDQAKLNRIDVFDQERKLEKSVEIQESVYDKQQNITDLSKPFLAFSKNGTAESAKFYFVNQCDVKDFKWMLEKGFNVTDSIVLCKYGGLFRGNKVKIAEKFGAKGVLLYDDPQRSAPAKSQDKKYPDGWLLPGDGTQRGCIYTKDGDPLTPMYPSKSYMHRIKESQQAGLPNIVAQVIGYDLAAELFNLMEPISPSVATPDEWRGELNVTYTLGGKLKDNRILAINVFGERKIQTIYNVMGIIKGSVEPDRYILVGNHKDSWAFGGMDPNSGTSVLMEITRALADLKKSGNWTPRRSVIFLTWDAEEYGLIGSTEWVEEFKSKLIANAVMYMNCDTAIQGTFALSAKASPLLHNFLYDVTKLIKAADNSNETIYDRWLKNERDLTMEIPFINPNLGSSSDHTSFTQRAGLPCLDLRLVRDYSNPVYKQLRGSYPLYHTSYETFKLVNTYVDPDFKASSTIGKLFAEIIRSTSGSLILPFNVTTYSQILTTELARFEQKYSKQLTDLGLTLNDVRAAIANFSTATSEFHTRLASIDKTQYHLVRAYNEQLRSLERAFLDDSNLKATGHAHTIFSPSLVNKYIGNTFPFVVEALQVYEEVQASGNSTEKEQALDRIKINLSILVYAIESASTIVRDPFSFGSKTS